MEDDIRAILREEGYSEEEIDIIMTDESLPKVSEEYEPLPEDKTEKDMVKHIKGEISKDFLIPHKSASIGINAIYRKLSIVDAKYGIEGIAGLSTKIIEQELKRDSEALASGDMTRIEGMLFSQSHVLQALCTNFLLKAGNSEHIGNIEILTRLALKAQNQCRQTLATLGELKNPRRATFIKQQNNAMNQQIDNEKPKKIINETSKL